MSKMPDKKRLVLWNAGNLPFGGTTIFARELLINLKKNKIEVFGISLHKINQKLVSDFEKRNIPILNPLRQPVRFVKIMIKAAFLNKRIILYSHGAGKLPWLLKKIFPNSAYIYHECVNIPEGESTGKRCVIKADKTIVNSEYVKKYIINRLPQKKDKIVFVPTLVPKHKHNIKTVKKNKNTQIRYAYVGRWAEHKRIKKLISDWPTFSKRLGQKSPELHIFSNIGNTERNNYKSYSEFKNVKFHKPFQNKNFSVRMQKVDCLLLPSLWEGQPISLIECASLGIPFVVCEGNGCNDFVEAYPDVIVCKKEWPSFLQSVKKMHQKILSNKISAQRLKAWTEKRFNQKKIVQKYVEIFKEI